MAVLDTVHFTEISQCFHVIKHYLKTKDVVNVGFLTYKILVSFLVFSTALTIVINQGQVEERNPREGNELSIFYFPKGA